MKKTAIVLGASGLTGSYVLERLLADNDYDKVIVFNRRTLGLSHTKLTEYIIGFSELEHQKEHFKADVVFCCIGTTKAKTPNKTLYRQIDYGIPVTAAKLCKTNSIDTFLVISAMGANKNSAVFYNKTKGEMEATVLAKQIRFTYILRPSLIKGNRPEARAGEDAANRLMKIINPLLVGALRKYRAIDAKTIAKAMLRLAMDKPTERKIILSDEIELLA